MAPLTVEVRGYIFSERVPGGSEICYPAIPEWEHANLYTLFTDARHAS